ncbi:MAG: DNA alkylation repair protein [Bacteroidaceae bacterium]|nr:DNA alkylation repair protein [Bacteroidaceae bacterium]
MKTAAEVISLMESMLNEEQQANLSRFFKTGKGQYGEGDKFLGIKVPQTRSIVKEAKTLPLSEVDILIHSPWHEIRLCGFLILVEQYKRTKSLEIVDFYLRNARQANNWDLVDLSVYKILGEWLLDERVEQKEKDVVMDKLSASDCLWEQRMSVVASMTPIKKGNFSYVWKYGELALTHKHDLMHKALGWMLRELGDADENELVRFLSLHCTEMPRTALRYAIEHLPEEERKRWMKK